MNFIDETNTLFLDYVKMITKIVEELLKDYSIWNFIKKKKKEYLFKSKICLSDF